LCILGILAAKQAAQVLAVDLNPYAINCAKENARLNGVRSNIAFIQADLFMALAKMLNSIWLPSMLHIYPLKMAKQSHGLGVWMAALTVGKSWIASFLKFIHI